jgi:hypothetical protein
MMQSGGDVHAASTETGERVAAGRYAHRRSKQTQVPSGGTLLSQPAAGGAAAAATQRLGRHGSSHAQSLSTAHGAAAEAPPLDGADEVALGPGVGLAPWSGLAVTLPGIAAPSAGVVAAVLVAGGVDGAGAGVELLQATIVTLATIVRHARNTLRFTARGVSPVPGPRHQSPRSRPRHDANARSYDNKLELSLHVEQARDLSSVLVPKPVVKLFVAWAIERDLPDRSRLTELASLMEEVKARRATGGTFVDAALARGLWDRHLVDRPDLRDFAYGWFQSVGPDDDVCDVMIEVFGGRTNKHGNPEPALDDDSWSSVDKASRKLDRVFAAWLGTAKKTRR